MRSIYLAPSLAVAFGCVAPRSDVSSSDLVGVWRLRGNGDLPTACDEASMEFRSDGTVLVKTGDQILTGTYTSEPAGGRLRVVQKDVRSNGKPNCQGIPADYVLEHYGYRIFAEVSGDTLRLYV